MPIRMKSSASVDATRSQLCESMPVQKSAITSAMARTYMPGHGWPALAADQFGGAAGGRDPSGVPPAMSEPQDAASESSDEQVADGSGHGQLLSGLDHQRPHRRSVCRHVAIERIAAVVFVVDTSADESERRHHPRADFGRALADAAPEDKSVDPAQ